MRIYVLLVARISMANGEFQYVRSCGKDGQMDTSSTKILLLAHGLNPISTTCLNFKTAIIVLTLVIEMGLGSILTFLVENNLLNHNTGPTG